MSYMKSKLSLVIISILVLVLVLSGCSFIIPYSPYSVSGYVKDTSGKPISGVTISIGAISTTTTDSNGHWYKDRLRGIVSITPSKSEYRFSPLNITVKGPRSDVNFTGIFQHITLK